MKICPNCQRKYAAKLMYCPRDGARLDELVAGDPLVGHIVDGRYRIDDRIDEGGIGIVYRAHHEQMPRVAALKILRREYTTNAELVARFQREVHTIVRIDHPNIVEVYDCGHDERAGYYVAMRFLEGQSLADRIDNGPQLTMLQALSVWDAVTDAVIAAHDEGVIHRDIKPDNIFLENDVRSPTGFVTRLLDFGLAKLTEGWTETHGQSSPRLTAASLAIGTPGTMAPEQIRGKEADERSDVYSLACVLHELLTGRQVFAANTRPEMYRLHVFEAAKPPSSQPGCSWITPATDELMLKMLAKERDERPRTVREVVRLLEKERHALEAGWTAAHIESELDFMRFEDIPARRTHLRQTAIGTDTVLVVDDETSIRKLIGLLLTRNGYEVAEATGGQEALMWLGRNTKPAAIVLDMMMPGMDGATCLRGIRSLGFTGPVVLCTSMDDNAIPQPLRDAPNVGIVDKVGALHEVIERIKGLTDSA